MAAFEITVLRSKKRRKTIQTKYVDGRLWIYLPAGMHPAQEKKWIDRMIARHTQSEQRHLKRVSEPALKQRADYFNKKYFEGALQFSITYVRNQHSRFGSCTSADKTIRISEQVKTMPRWVQDYVIIHELAHLRYPDHSKKFWGLVNQYPYAERAKGYLIALGSTSLEFDA